MAVSTPIQPRILRLPPLVINQIAAGEVVDRPASVVKELLDNALDASAKRITVEIEQGGIELIRITDDGLGIPPDDLPLAIAPHATSKVRTAEDLDSIATMGFRGEALASIASVSRLSIRSRTTADPAAAQIEIEGDVAGQVRPASGPVGTAVTVRNLFFNTPARRKFLRTPATEQGHCIDTALDLALAHCAIGFRVVADNKTIFDVPPDQSPQQRILALLGSELADLMLDVHVDQFDDARGLAMWGLVGKPEIARASAKAQHIYLNGRPIRDKTIQHAIKEAYRGLIEPGRYPTAVLLIEMDPRSVDVNVHPAKTEVRFRDQSIVHGVVLRALRDRLRDADLTPIVTSTAPAFPPSSPALASSPHFNQPTLPGSPVVPARAFVDYLSRYSQTKPPSQPFDYQTIRAAVQGIDSTGPESFAPIASTTPSSPIPSNLNAATNSQATPTDFTLPVDQNLLQVHKSYIVTQDQDGLVIVDQHALHERVMFEALLARIGEGNLESQRLLMPAIVTIEPRQGTRLDDLAPLLTRLGITAEPISPTAVAIQSFPSFLFERKVDPVDFMQDLLERADSEGFSPQSEAALHEVLDMMACKAAIKAGDQLSQAELGDLLRLRDLVERSSNCPHGRPTSIRLTIKELEKRFGRA